VTTWLPIFVLPNVLVKEPIENEFLALVAPDDPRSIEIGSGNKNFLPFLNAFTDAFQHKVDPSVLLVRRDAPSWVMSMDAVIGFRDAISISAVTRNRTLTLLFGNPKPHQYSSFFDFYAWVFSRDFELLITSNPALAGMDTFVNFKGQSTAGLPVSRWDTLTFDEPLLAALLGEWTRRFSNPKHHGAALRCFVHSIWHMLPLRCQVSWVRPLSH
jgi:hypothetical protein